MTDYGAVFNDSVHKTFDDGFPLLMPRWGYVVSAFVLFLIGFFGFFLNLMVILLMFKDRQLWTPLNIILFNLVCSDFSVSVLGNPFTLVSALFHRWIFGRTMCVLYGFFMALLGITSITTLTVISFERYMMVTRPLNSRHLSQKGAALSVLFIWTYSLALTTPPLMGWGNYVNEAANISCSVNWHEQSMNTLTYILFLFALGQIVPLGIITFSYVNIIRTMKKNSQRLGRVSRAEARATSMVFIMIIAFTVAWTPYSVFALLEQFATEGIVSPGAGVIPALVAKSSICYDPLIYVGMNSQFRQSIKRLFGIHNKRNSRVDKAYNNTVMSPAQIQDATTRYNSSETNQSIIIRKNNDTKTLVVKNSTDPHNDVNLTQKNIELGTIQEYKTVSDAERSGETIYEEDSSNNKKQLDVFGESCQLLDSKSPVITILDTETMLFRKQSMVNQETDGSELYKNIYGNQAYEDHATDNVNAVSITDNERTGTHKVIKHSFSLDLATPPADTKKRKASIEATLEALVQPKGFFKDSVVSKIFEQDSLQGQDNLKTFLYTQEKSDSTENEL